MDGGGRGFDRGIWDGEEESGESLKLDYLCGDGEEGFGGNLDIEVR